MNDMEDFINLIDAMDCNNDLELVTVDYLHSHLPNSWFDDVHQFFGSGLTDEMIAQSVQEASAFFNMNAPMSVHEDWTTGVLTKMSFTENDDILVFNRQQMYDMGIKDKEGFDLVMTHEGAHRKLQGLYTGYTPHQEELCCDYMAGVRAGLNGMAEGKLEASLAGTVESASHPDGALRVEAIESGVAFAHKYLNEHNNVPPTFGECLGDFNNTDVYASTVPQEPGHVNLRPEHAFTDMESDVHEFNRGRYGNATGDYIDDSSRVNDEPIKSFIDNRATHLQWAKEAKENAEWHEKRSNDAIARGDLTAAKDHADRAASYRRKERDEIAISKSCTK